MNVRTGDFYVESIGKGKKRGKEKIFRSLKAAKIFAKLEYKKGRGVMIDKITKTGQSSILQKGMERTGFKKPFAINFGKW